MTKAAVSPSEKVRDERGADDRFGDLTERYPWIRMVLVLAVVIIIFLFSVGTDFLDRGNIATILLSSSQILLMAVPMTFVISMAGLDLSVGAILILSSVASATVMGHVSGSVAQEAQLQYPHAGAGIALGVLVGVGVGAVCGLGNGLLVAYLRLPAFIVTLGTLGMYTGLAQVFTGGTNRASVPPALQDKFGQARWFGLIPPPFILALIVAVLGWVVLALTRYGRRTLAIGANESAARLAGINIKFHQVRVYVAIGCVAGIAGVIDLAQFASTSIEAHTQDNLLAIEAVVLGGTSLFGGIGNVGGTVAGAFLPPTLENGFVQLGVPSFWQPVIVGGILIAAVAQDMISRRRRAKR